MEWGEDPTTGLGFPPHSVVQDVAEAANGFLSRRSGSKVNGGTFRKSTTRLRTRSLGPTKPCRQSRRKKGCSMAGPGTIVLSRSKNAAMREVMAKPDSTRDTDGCQLRGDGKRKRRRGSPGRNTRPGKQSTFYLRKRLSRLGTSRQFYECGYPHIGDFSFNLIAGFKLAVHPRACA